MILRECRDELVAFAGMIFMGVVVQA